MMSLSRLVWVVIGALLVVGTSERGSLVDMGVARQSQPEWFHCTGAGSEAAVLTVQYVIEGRPGSSSLAAITDTGATTIEEAQERAISIADPLSVGSLFSLEMIPGRSAWLAGSYPRPGVAPSPAGLS
jgi:hypothetical protein